MAAFMAMLAAAALWRVDHLTHWDSWDYASQAIMAESSDLGLGRWWFIAAMRAVYISAGVAPLEGYVVMQAASALAMASAVVVGMAVVRRLGGRSWGEVMFAAVVISGPLFGMLASAWPSTCGNRWFAWLGRWLRIFGPHSGKGIG